MVEKIKNSYTIVPAPLGIEPNTIKYHQHTWILLVSEQGTVFSLAINSSYLPLTPLWGIGEGFERLPRTTLLLCRTYLFQPGRHKSRRAEKSAWYGRQS